MRLLLFILLLFVYIYQLPALDHVDRGDLTLTTNYIGVPTFFDTWFLPSLKYDMAQIDIDAPYQITPEYSELYNDVIDIDATTSYPGVFRVIYDHGLRVNEMMGWKRFSEFSIGYRYQRKRIDLSGELIGFRVTTSLDTSDDLTGYVSVLGAAQFSLQYTSDIHTLAIAAPLNEGSITLGYSLSPVSLHMRAHVLPEGFVSINGMDYFFTPEHENSETTLSRHYYVTSDVISHSLFAHYTYPLSSHYSVSGGIRVHKFIASGSFKATTHIYEPLASDDGDLIFDVSMVDLGNPTRTQKRIENGLLHSVEYPSEIRLGITYTSFLTSHAVHFLLFSGNASIAYNDTRHTMVFKKGVSYTAETPYVFGSLSLIECVINDVSFPIGEISLGVRVPLSSCTAITAPLASSRQMPGSFRFAYTQYPEFLERKQEQQLLDTIRKKDEAGYEY